MGEPYVTFPGTVGRYADCPDVNLLDADTAHFEQAVPWTAATSVVQSTDKTPLFGSYVLKMLGIWAHGQGGTPAVPIVAGNTYAIGMDVFLPSTNTVDTLRLVFRWFDSSGAYLSDLNFVTASRATDQWVRIEETGTAPTSAAYVAPMVVLNGAATTDITYIERVTIRAGTDASWRPSHRIVSKASIKAKIACVDYTAAAIQVILDTLASSKGLRLAVTTSGELEARYGDGTSENVGTSAGASLTDGTAYELAATIDPAVGTWDFYKDGSSFDTDAIGVFNPLPGGGAVTVAAAVGGASLNLNGDAYWVDLIDGDLNGLVVARFDASPVLAAVT